MLGGRGRGRIEIERETRSPSSRRAAGVREQGAWAGGEEPMRWNALV